MKIQSINQTPVTKTSKKSELKTESVSNLEVISLLNQSNFPVYLCKDNNTQKKYAMKVFHYVDDKINPNYVRETKFSNFLHPNIITIHKKVDEKKTIQGNEIRKSSYTVMDLCFFDFATLIQDYGVFNDEKLTRTFFNHLVEGLSFVHSNDVAHLDLKLDNLLLSENFTLKISDFDKAWNKGQVVSLGSRNYRAPEIVLRQCRDPKKADIFSLGICLFVMMMGIMPYDERSENPDKDLFLMLLEDREMFWNKHLELNPNFRCENNFKQLFSMMVDSDPKARPTINEVKLHPFCKGPVYTSGELEQIMKKRLIL